MVITINDINNFIFSNYSAQFSNKSVMIQAYISTISTELYKCYLSVFSLMFSHKAIK